MRGTTKNLTDLELCKLEVTKILNEYNCSLISADEWSRVLLIDNDTQKSVLADGE